MIFLSMCFLVFYNYIVAQKGHYDFFFLHNYMDFIQNQLIASQFSSFISEASLLLVNSPVSAPKPAKFHPKPATVPPHSEKA